MIEIFAQITLALPRFIAASKRLLERGEIAAPFNSMSYVAYESNIDFEIRLVFKNAILFFLLIISVLILNVLINRYMVDAHIVGCNWIELPPGSWKQRPHSNTVPVTRYPFK